MALRITLKVAPRTSREFEIDLTEEELGDCRRQYWDDARKAWAASGKELPLGEAVASALLTHYGLKRRFPKDSKEEVVVVKAIASLSLWVEGIYWYKDRTPPVSKHTRVRAFFKDDGTVVCPRCDYVLCEDFDDYTEEPVAFSKTLNNPRFICPHCNSMVMVSSRSSEYQQKSKVPKT